MFYALSFKEAIGARLNAEKAFTQVVDKLTNWIILFFKMLPNLIVGIIIILIFWILSVYAARLTNRLTLRFTGYSHIARLFSRLTTLLLVILGIILAFDALNLNKAVSSMLAGIGIAGIALGFAAKDLFADYIAGIILHFEHPFRLGDRVQTLQQRGTPSGWSSNEIIGYIETIKWRSTVIRGRRGERYTIPNKDILGNPIVNYYMSGNRRIDLYIGINYTPDLQQVEDLAIKAVGALDPPLRNPDRPVEIFYEEAPDTTLKFRIRFWTNDPEQMVFLKARSEAIKAINQAFTAEMIDRPSTNVTLDFATGKTSLKKQLENVKLLSLPEEPEGRQDRNVKNNLENENR